MCIISEEGRRPGLVPSFSKGNNDEKKEKSRDAARERRAKEHEYFQELEELLPSVQTAAEKGQDKTSLIRLTVAYLRSREVAANGLTTVKEEADSMPEVDLLSCLDGFSLVIGAESDVIYVSTNVSSLIGLRPAELLGQTLADYIHHCDQAALESLTAPLEDGRERPAEVTLRIKCTVTERGRVVNLHQASYKPLHVSGTTRELPPSEGRPARQVFLGLVGPVGPAALGQQQLGVFSSRHSLDMKFLEVDSCLTSLAGHPVTSLLGESFFGLVHPGDAQHVQMAFRNLREQGLCSTQPYRLLAGGGGYCWLQTKASCAPARRGSTKTQMIQCQHWQLTGVEEPGSVMASVQKRSPAPTSTITRPQKKPNLVIIEPRQETRPSGLPTSVIVSSPGIHKMATNSPFIKANIDESEMTAQSSISISTNKIFGAAPEPVPLLALEPHNDDVVVAEEVVVVQKSHEEEMMDEHDFFSAILNFDLGNMDQFAPHHGDDCVNIKTKGAGQEHPTVSIKEEEDKSLLESFVLSTDCDLPDTVQPSQNIFSLELPSVALLHPEADIMWGASNGLGDLLNGELPQEAELLMQPTAGSWGLKRGHSHEDMEPKKVRVVQSGNNQFIIAVD